MQLLNEYISSLLVVAIQPIQRSNSAVDEARVLQIEVKYPYYGFSRVNCCKKTID